MATSSPPSTGTIKSVAVVGGGVSGLAAAYKLKSNGVNVIVFESEGRAGGKLRSNSEGGFLWDEGANTMTESEKEVGNLIDALDLRDKQQFPLSQQKRYVVKNGKPEMLPFGPISFIKSSVLSTQSKIKCLMEPFMWKPFNQNNKISNEVSEESVGNFFERHFGKEIVDYCVDPFVAGTNGGDPESLYMPYAFPGLWDLEKKYGSLLIGGILSKINSKNSDKNKQNAPVKKRNTRASFSFHGGMQVLVDSLSKEIGGDNVKLNSKVLSLSYNYYDKNSPNGTWSISCDTKDSVTKNLTKKQSFDAIIMTAPLSHVQEMKFSKGKSPCIIDFLPKVNYLPLSVLVTAFKKENVKRPLEGFGVLVPSKEQEKNGLKTLGTLFSSMMFPDRAPNDQYLYTTFIGGSRNKDLGGASFDVLKEIVSSDLRKLLGAEGQPSFVKHVYWKNAFPLYGHDYNKVLEAMDKMEKNLPGFFCAGNHKDGLAVGKAIASGSKAADLVISYLNS